MALSLRLLLVAVSNSTPYVARTFLVQKHAISRTSDILSIPDYLLLYNIYNYAIVIKMQVVRFEIDQLQPLQMCGVASRNLDTIIKAMGNGYTPRPGIVIPSIGPDTSKPYLLADGHHTTRATHDLGGTTIEHLLVHDTDDLPGFIRALKHFKDGIEPVQQMYSAYGHDEFIGAGIMHIADLPVFNGTRQEMFASIDRTR